MTAWETTTLFVGEYSDADAPNNPILSVADGIVWLYQSIERNSGVRKIQVLKMRGQAPTFRVDFRESLYRMVVALTGSGVTGFMTVEVAESFTDLRFSPDLISFLTDDVISQRYVEIEGRVRKVMTEVCCRRGRGAACLRVAGVRVPSHRHNAAP